MTITQGSSRLVNEIPSEAVDEANRMMRNWAGEIADGYQDEV